MKGKNNSPWKKFISESLIRDIVLFTFLFLLVIAQDWDNILFLLFPLISFSFALFFKIIDTYKSKNIVNIIYNPLGLEKNHSNRLNFCALLQLILLFWFGAESLYHPQLVDDYYIYFVSIFIFFYTFGFFWIFIDLWKYSRIEIISEGIDHRETQKLSNNFELVVSFLKIKHFKIISILSLLVFVILNSLNIFFALYTVLPVIKYNLPGTGIEDSDPINISIIIYGTFIAPPICAIIFLYLSYRDINDINQEKLNEVLKDLPQNIRTRITENLKALNKKLNKNLRI